MSHHFEAMRDESFIPHGSGSELPRRWTIALATRILPPCSSPRCTCIPIAHAKAFPFVHAGSPFGGPDRVSPEREPSTRRIARSSSGHAARGGGLISGPKKVGAFFGATLILFVFVWPPWLLLLQDAAASVVAGLARFDRNIVYPSSAAPSHGGVPRRPQCGGLFLAICFVRWLC